jgi:hypothetical protein
MNTLTIVLVFAAAVFTATAAEPFRQTLISVSQNVHLEKWEITGKKVTVKSPRWSVRKLTLHGGKQEGVDVIIVDNGKLQFTVVPARGMGVLSARWGAARVDSPVLEVASATHQPAKPGRPRLARGV